MGVVSTYAELKTAIADYSGRGGSSTYVSNLPVFIRRAHDTLMRELKIPLMMVSADLTIDAERVAVPSGFRAVERLYIDSDTDSQLSPVSIEQRVAYSLQYASGRPLWFAVEGGYLAFAPVPDASYVGKLLYRKALDFFTTAESTNDLLTRYPMAYVYGALAEAARFDKEETDVALYEAMFRAEIADINAAEQTNALAGGALSPTPSGGVA